MRFFKSKILTKSFPNKRYVAAQGSLLFCFYVKSQEKKVIEQADWIQKCGESKNLYREISRKTFEKNTGIKLAELVLMI